ncbi:MAG: di-heme-cytochrome C peroxidase [Pseudomonas sp.]|uniref:di-heme-cytochrome C peroxidase n=1 Tax=Pseudomonas sp. TaxID=306 RepID=UPI00299D83C8|nr:di-heme-cytochrome C peroxidase [Pseudomonas sp.]MDX1721614.1 di-heme-cytochrome C peroxidase [Pseudomonas sp.]
MSKAIASRWLGRVLLLIALLVLAVVGAFVYYVQSSKARIPRLEPVDEYRYLNNGWQQSSRETYYHTPQGASMPQGAGDRSLRYNWFLNLEQPLSQERFADPSFLQRFHFLFDPSHPDQLPVGFASRYSASLGEDLLDISCAACHTGQLHYRKEGKQYALRIDGGQAMHAFTDLQRGSFGPTLISALAETWANPLKFNRFAGKVLADGGDSGQLHEQLGETLKTFLAIQQNNPLAHLYPTREGFGRTDALGRIANTVFGEHLSDANLQTSSAPVSYPYLWNMWKFNWVQYNGSVAQPLARNIGEALGVGAEIRLVNAEGTPLPVQERFRSSVNIPGLEQIERALQQLPPPQWPEDIFGAVDQAKAARGEQLFQNHCVECHGPHPSSRARQQAEAPLKAGPEDHWLIEVIGIEHIGTDPTEAQSFLDRTYDLSATGITQADVKALIKPLLQKQLARDMLMRLRELAIDEALSDEAQAAFAALADAFPAPDRLAAQGFEPSPAPAIKAALEQFELKPSVQLSASYAAYPQLACDSQCQVNALWYDLDYAQAGFASLLASIDPSKITEGLGLNLIDLLLKQRYYQDNNLSEAQQACLEGFGALDLPQQIVGYKPRPLAGVWATPPFLHNGSVPTLYQMLVPATERDQRFFVGPRDYDPVNLGYTTAQAPGGEYDGFWFDTSLTGNHNSGHSFQATPAQWQAYSADPSANPLPSGVIGPLLSDEDRYALLEYLKIRRDNPPGYAYQGAPACLSGQD